MLNLKNQKYYVFSILKTFRYLLKKLKKEKKRTNTTKIKNKDFGKSLLLLLRLI